MSLTWIRLFAVIAHIVANMRVLRVTAYARQTRDGGSAQNVQLWVAG
jgi:hypothetical protein